MQKLTLTWPKTCHDSEFTSLYHVLLCICFGFPCPILSLKFLLCSPLCLPLSVVLFPSCVLMCFITTPGLLHPLSSPVPHLFISVCVFPSLLVRSLYSVYLMFLFMRLFPVPHGICFWTWVLYFASWVQLWLLIGTLVFCLHFVLLFNLLLWLFVLDYFCTWNPLFVYLSFKNKAHLLFFTDLASCLTPPPLPIVFPFNPTWQQVPRKVAPGFKGLVRQLVN